MAQAATSSKISGERTEPGQGGCAGYAVLDAEGRRIGTVKEIFANESGEPEYVRMGMGPFGFKLALIPVQFVALDAERRTLTLH